MRKEIQHIYSTLKPTQHAWRRCTGALMTVNLHYGEREMLEPRAVWSHR